MFGMLAALGVTAATTMLGMGAAERQAEQQRDSFLDAARVSDINADKIEKYYSEVLYANLDTVSTVREHVSRFLSTQEAQFAGSGIDMQIGSARATLEGTRLGGTLDVNRAITAAYLNAENVYQQAFSQRQAGVQQRAQAAGISVSAARAGALLQGLGSMATIVGSHSEELAAKFK